MTANVIILVPVLLACGAFAGTTAGLLGVGGGIVIVPLLYHVYTALAIATEIAMPLAVGTSLATIVLTSTVSARSHNRRGTVDWALIRYWAPAVVIGVVLGMAASFVISGASLKAAFGTLLTVASLHMLVTTFRPITLATELPSRPAQSTLGVIVGGFSALLGIGGGTMMVPILNLYSYPIHRAVATASVFGVIIAVPATAAYIVGGWGRSGLPLASTGFVNWLAFAILVPATMRFAPLGVRLAYRLNVTQLKRVFALFLLAVGIKMVVY
jgi:uncharacterized protein